MIYYYKIIDNDNENYDADDNNVWNTIYNFENKLTGLHNLNAWTIKYRIVSLLPTYLELLDIPYIFI